MDVKVLIAVLLTFALLIAFPLRLAPPKGSSPEEVRRYFSEEEILKGKAYMRGRYLLFFFGLFLKAIFLILLLTPASKPLEATIRGLFPGRPVLTFLFYALVLFILYQLLMLPLGLYRDFLREKAFGLSTQTLQGWLWDQLKGMALGFVLFLPLVSLLYAFIHRFPETWYLLAGLLASFVIVFLTVLSPVIVDPLFHRFKPVEGSLRARALALAEKAGVRTDRIFEMDASRRTMKKNAYVSGLFQTKRIVLYDTLIKGSTPEEVELVLAHELSHWKLKHLWKGVGVAILFAFLGLFLASRALRGGVGAGLLAHPAEPKGLVVIALALFLFALATLPLQNAISRSFEREADLESLHLTQNPEAFIQAEVKLAKGNLADLDPHPAFVLLLYTHPPVLERIQLAESYRPSPSPSPQRGEGRGEGAPQEGEGVSRRNPI